MNKLEQDIIDLLQRENKPLTIERMAKTMRTNKKDIRLKLRELQNDLKIRKETNGSYKLFETQNMEFGTVAMDSNGNGIVKIGTSNEFHIPNHKLNGARNGDIVLVSFKQNKHGKVIIKIEEKVNHDSIIKSGIVFVEDNVFKIKSESLPGLNIIINNPVEMGEGNLVLFRMVKQKNNNYAADIFKVFDHKNDVWSDTIPLVKSMGIIDAFSNEALKEASKLPTEVLPRELKNRRDLRSEQIFTIDGADAKDLDDAISLKINEQGNYVLGLHIADVSHYVPLDSAIGKEAYNRGTSVYLVNRVIPMLPKTLSNGICSLTEGVDRLTLTCEIELTPSGDIVNYDIYESVINSKKRMVYNEVNDILEKNKIVPSYEPFIKTLNKMKNLSHLIREKKDKRGTIDFGIQETYINVDERGIPINVALKNRGESELIIEDFMILANEGVAKYIYDKNLPFLYRNHLAPKESKIDEVVDLIASIGYEVKKESIDNSFDCAKTIKLILEEIKDNPEFSIIAKIMVCSMQKAYYSPNNEKHFGIASDCYTHFTAPIRRFPDLTVHHLLKQYIIENNYNIKNLKAVRTKLDDITRHSSSMEMIANKCEREVIKMKHAEYMENHVGEKFEGLVSNITTRGVYVQLDNLIQGLVEMNKMNKSFVYDPKSITLTSINDDLIYRIGSKVNIVVDDVDKEIRTIEFSIDKGFQKTCKLK